MYIYTGSSPDHILHDWVVYFRFFIYFIQDLSGKFTMLKQASTHIHNEILSKRKFFYTRIMYGVMD